MKLHYSQTKLVNMEKASEVSVPYEITLLSNMMLKLKKN